MGQFCRTSVEGKHKYILSTIDLFLYFWIFGTETTDIIWVVDGIKKNLDNAGLEWMG